MGYRIVDPDDVEVPEGRPCEYRSLTDAGDLDEMAMNLFRAEPGEQLPLAYHYHEQQEEAFFVLSGTLFVETPGQTYEVPEGHLSTVDPESPQRAHNPEDAEERVELLAVGAPPAPDDAVAYDPSEDD